MSKVIRRFGWVLLLAVAVVTAMAVPSPTSTATAGTCYGQWIDYFETSACVNWVSTRVVCPGYPDQWDLGPGASATPTPYSVSQQIVCPCPSSGGGQNGGADPDEWGE